MENWVRASNPTYGAMGLLVRRDRTLSRRISSMDFRKSELPSLLLPYPSFRELSQAYHGVRYAKLDANVVCQATAFSPPSDQLSKVTCVRLSWPTAWRCHPSESAGTGGDWAASGLAGKTSPARDVRASSGTDRSLGR